jgi:hypothetical protein
MRVPGRVGRTKRNVNLIESLAMAVLNQAVLFAEKLWIVLGIGALIGLAVVIWRAQIKKRRTEKP